MESANLHHQHHQLQDLQLVQSSPLSTPFCYGGVGSLHAWTPNNTILNNSGNFINTNTNGVNPRDPKQQNDILAPSLNSSMIQDLGFHWASPAGSFTAHDLQLARIKHELPEYSYPKFTEMNTPSSTIEELRLNYMKNEQRNFNDLCEFYSNAQNCSSRGSFSQIFPSVNISNFNNQSTATISSSLDMNLEALDLFNSARFSGSFSPSSNHHLGVFKDSYSNYGIDHMQQLSHKPSNCPSKVSPFTTGVPEAKRSVSLMESKSPQAAPKKSRLDNSRVSCPPLKVRKEKLGDRIAALQQLVAPFGKTDTASVLMEAIGYIKFLQNQVETLSVPYMKSSRNKTSRTMQGGSRENGDEESRRDLRSRGLCLVPLSCLSYVTDGGGGVWPPSTFSGGT